MVGSTEPTPVRILARPLPGSTPDLQLSAALFLPTPPDGGLGSPGAPALIVGHGAGSRAANHREFCFEAVRQGFVVLALYFRGHGNSAGIADGPLELDILAATDYLRSHSAVDAGLICYRGSSMGGFYGLKAASLTDFAAMVLLCPAGEDVILDALDDESDTEIEGDSDVVGDTEIEDDVGTESGSEARGDDSTGGVAWQDQTTGRRNRGVRRTPATTARWDRPRLRSYFRQQDSRRLAAQVECPVLIVHARPDQQVPFEHSLLIARYLRPDTTILALENGSHTSAQHDPAIHRYTVAWLRDRVTDTSRDHG